MVSESQKRAMKAYRKRNPLKITYSQYRSYSRSFVNPPAGTKAQDCMQWGIDNDLYEHDLRQLRAMIDERLKYLHNHD